MAVDVIIDPSSGQIYWNDAAGSGTQTIAISGNATNAINIVGYSNFFSPGGGGLGTQILATFTDSATSTFTPGTNAYDLGSSSLRWNFYGTGGNFTGAISTSSTTDSTSSTTGALTVAGGAGIAKTSYFGQDVIIQGSTASTTPTTGALVVTGGVGISGKLSVGSKALTAGSANNLAGFASSNDSSSANIRIQNTSPSINSTVSLIFASDASVSSIAFYNSNSGSFTSTLRLNNNNGNIDIFAGSGKTISLQAHGALGGLGVGINSSSTNIQQTTISTSSTTGALTVSGGAGIALTSYFGQDVFIQGITASGSTTTGALTVSGGVGIGGSLNVFGTIDVSNDIEVLSQKEVRFFNSANTFYTGLRAGSSSANVTFTLPIADGSANQVLYTNGSAGLAWTSLASVSAITSLNGLTASTQTFATGTSGTDFNISSSTSTHTFNIPYAGSGATGLVTTQAQTIAGSKTFSSQTIISDTTASTTTATGALLVYGGLGVSGQVNAASLQTSGNAVISGNLTFNGVGVFGNATSDTINSLARYISDILPSTDNSYDLGNNSLGWRNFRVSGVGTIATLAVTSSTASTTPTTGALVVTGGVGIGGSLWTSTSNLASVSGVTLNNGTITGTLSGTATSAQVLATTTDTSSTLYLLGSRSSTGFAGTSVYVDTNISFSGSTITASLTGTATTATAAIGVNVSNAATNSTHYIRFSPTATGTGLATSTNTSLTYNPSTNILSATTFSGSFSGSLTGTASIATSSVNSATTTDTTSTLYLLGSRSSTGFAGTALYVDSSISILGSQITAGVWGGTAISAVNGGTGQVSYTVGDLLYASSTTALSKLAAGTAGSVLGSNGAGTAPSWKAPSSGGTPAGSSSWLQYNNGGSFGATSHLAYNGNVNNDFVISAPYSGSTQGQVNIGLGITGFDGVTLGKFAGSASGTVIAVNQASGFTGNFADFQLAGSSKFTIGYDGKITLVGVFSFPTTAGTAGSVLKSNGTGNQLYWAADSTGGGGGTVASPSAASLVAYYPGTGASVASYSRVSINTAAASMELLAQNSLPALVVNATNGAVVDSVEFKSSFGDVYWALSSTTQILKSLNGGILKIDGSGIITVTAPGSLTFYNSAETFYTSFIGAATADVTYTLPPTAPATGTSVLQSSTGGTLSWVAMSSGGSGTVTSGTAGSVAYYTGSGTTVGGAPGFTYTTSGTASTINVFGGSAIGTTIFTVQATSSTSVRVGIGTNLPQYELEIVGEISATNKSFVIDHPTKPGKKLRYGSLEGPENGVYVRGELKDSNTIETPDHWEGLVYPDSFTVTLTPIGRFSHLYVEKIEDYKVFIADAYMNPIHCYYTVWAERKDIPKLITEY